MCAEVNAKNRMGGYNGYEIALVRLVQGKAVFFNLVEDADGQRSFLCGKMPAREVPTGK